MGFVSSCCPADVPLIILCRRTQANSDGGWISSECLPSQVAHKIPRLFVRLGFGSNTSLRLANVSNSDQLVESFLDHLFDNEMTSGKDANASNLPFPTINLHGNRRKVQVPVNMIPIRRIHRCIADLQLSQSLLRFVDFLTLFLASQWQIIKDDVAVLPAAGAVALKGKGC
jgi:hypothetical protein